jgi:uncharacterized protein
MRFWDSSAVVPLLVEEPATADLLGSLRNDPAIAVWWGTRLECVSALRRREREGALDATGVLQALKLLDTLSDGWIEVLASNAVRGAAERALAVHSLRAADALQLAAAITWRGGDPAGAGFVCLDERLADVASREGFSVQ